MPAPAPLLSHPDEVTPDWLTEALTRSGRVAPGHRVVDLDAVTIGNGKVGQNIRFGLTWEPTDAPGADQLPPSVVGKFASDDETSRMAGMLTGTYLREWAFYSELADPTRMAVPSCHVAELDAASGAFVLLFDDVTPAEAGDQIAGCSVDEAALALAELGRLHAYWWADPRLDGRDWLVRRGHDGGQGLADLYQAFVGSFLDRFGDRLTPEAAAVAERFTPLVTDWVARDTEPFTLLHGDYRLENLLFGRGPDVAPLTIVDWQTPSVGPGPSDAAYFLGGGLAVDDRRANERDLLDQYRAALAAGGVELDADACWDAYRVGALTGLHMTVVASVLVGQDDRGDLMFLAMAERHAAHVTDMGSLELLSGGT